MFYYSVESNSKIAHFEGCHHLKNIKPENLRTFKDIREIRNGRYRICSCCSPIIKQLRKEQNEIERFCLENGLSYFVTKCGLNIRTHHSKWKVLASNSQNKLELHHGNSYKKDHMDSVPGYHKQSCSSGSILEYMKYINEHEYYRMINPLQIFVKKEPPRKGTKRWNKQQKALKRKERKQEIWNVINLIDSLSANTFAMQA